MCLPKCSWPEMNLRAVVESGVFAERIAVRHSSRLPVRDVPAFPAADSCSTRVCAIYLRRKGAERIFDRARPGQVEYGGARLSHEPACRNGPRDARAGTRRFVRGAKFASLFDVRESVCVLISVCRPFIFALCSVFSLLFVVVC